MTGRLFLVPAPLDFGCAEQVAIDAVLPASTISQAASLEYWITENARTTRAFLKRVGEVEPLAKPLRELVMTELPREVHKKGDHTGKFDARPLLSPALEGHDVGLASEAGMPAVADPGSSVVRAAHELGVEVVPLVGPVSLLLALAASGLNGQGFSFVGYLPQAPVDREKRIRELEAIALRSGQSQLFIEAPYRNTAVWQSLVKTLQPGTRLACASGLTLPSANIQSRLVRDWKSRETPVANDVPAVFLFGA